MQTFRSRVIDTINKTKTMLCVGLDPDPARMPVPDVYDFNRRVIDSTKDIACAFKLNLAFYEALGIEGLIALQRTLSHIRETAPGLLVIGDSKRSDIPSSSRRYAEAMFEQWQFDAVTALPYLGEDSLLPFCTYEGKGLFVVSHSSNSGATDFQSMPLKLPTGDSQLHEWVVTVLTKALPEHSLGFVVGATDPTALSATRRINGTAPLLIPGVGAQSGNISVVVKRGLARNRDGSPMLPNLLISSSRSIIYAGTGKRFYEDVRLAALEMKTQIDRSLLAEGADYQDTVPPISK